MTRRWHPELGGSLMPPTLTERYEQVARDLNLCGCEWCEGHPATEDTMTDYAIAHEGLADALEAIAQQAPRPGDTRACPEPDCGRPQHYSGVELGWCHDALVDTWHCADPRKAGA